MNKHPFLTRLVKKFDPILEIPGWRWYRKALNRLALESEDVFFVQIGSNDGVIHDPLFDYVTRYRWHGILVEPIGYYFERLKANYKNHKNLIFENVAISTKDEIRDFYRVREGLEFLPAWSKGLGSFYPHILLKHQWAIPNLKEYMVKDRVRCTSLPRLLGHHNINRIDLLMVDTEGYDFEILKQVDFNRVKPRVIIYEHKHLDKAGRRSCEQLLRGKGYRISSHLSNTMALLL